MAGLFLAKYDSLALKKLGFDSFVEAFNVIGYALGGKPMAIKNYRDEFDPLFPNRRKGWHKRSRRDYCLDVMEEYRTLDLETFTALIKAFGRYDDNLASERKRTRAKDGGALFAQRLVTGLAAERYFEAVFPKLVEFSGFMHENTTRLGCGYDFRLQTTAEPDFLAVEVKGIKESRGGVSLTPKGVRRGIKTGESVLSICREKLPRFTRS